jgi:hypothetical protein
LAQVPAGTHAYNLGGLALAPATYTIYVQAVGKPSIENKLSPAMGYHPGDSPPSAALAIKQSGALTYSASTAPAVGAISRATIDFGDGTVVSGRTATHTYAAVGNYIVTAYVYDRLGASTVARQQLTVKPPSSGVTILIPANGSTVNWPTQLVASANASVPVATMRVLIDGQQAYANTGATLNTALKVFTGTHQLTVQALNQAGTAIASSAVKVIAEPNDIPPIAVIGLRPLPNLSPTTVLGCTAASRSPNGFLIFYSLKYSDGSQFSTPAALRTFAAPGKYTASATVTDQFGATNTTSESFSVGGGTAPALVTAPAPAAASTAPEPMRLP